MSQFFAFLTALIPVLEDLFMYTQKPADQRSVDQEQQLAMRVVRAAVVDRARREITGP